MQKDSCEGFEEMMNRLKDRKKRCAGKVRYRRFCKGVRAADQYNQQMALVSYPMVCYWCSAHHCFHKGHDTYMSADQEMNFLVSSRGRATGTCGSPMSYLKAVIDKDFVLENSREEEINV